MPVKSVEQQVITSLHRLRSGCLAECTAQINTLRRLLREFGLVIPVGAHHVLPCAGQLITDADSGLPPALRESFAAVGNAIRTLEERIKSIERQLTALTRQLPMVEQLCSIPGIGLLTATAVIALTTDIRRFPSARHFASSLGLTPREHSSGNKRHLGAISKQGNIYLRMLLIHGARATLWYAKRVPHPDRLRCWALVLERRVGHNQAAVALANKLACIVWAVWTHHRPFASVAHAAEGLSFPTTAPRIE